MQVIWYSWPYLFVSSQWCVEHEAPKHKSQPPLSFGLLLRPELATSVLERGPPADSPKVNRPPSFCVCSSNCYLGPICGGLSKAQYMHVQYLECKMSVWSPRSKNLMQLGKYLRCCCLVSQTCCLIFCLAFLDNNCGVPWLGGWVSAAVGVPLRAATLPGRCHNRSCAVGRKERVPEAADSQTDHHTPAATVCTLFSFTSQYWY